MQKRMTWKRPAGAHRIPKQTMDTEGVGSRAGVLRSFFVLCTAGWVLGAASVLAQSHSIKWLWTGLGSSMLQFPHL